MDLHLAQGEAVFTGMGRAMSGGVSGSEVVIGADDHGSVQVRCAAGETVTVFIGGVAIFFCEVDGAGQPLITFNGPVRAHGFHDITPQAPVAPR